MQNELKKREEIDQLLPGKHRTYGGGEGREQSAPQPIKERRAYE